MQLFDIPPSFIDLNLRHAEFKLMTDFIRGDVAESLMYELVVSTPFVQKQISIYGKKYNQPRLVAYYGDEGTRYSYSGATYDPLPWTPKLAELREIVQEMCMAEFNSVLVNYYRDGADSIGWHSDNEPELGEDPIVASVSLGDEREFLIGDRRTHQVISKIGLPNGSLLLMGKGSQIRYEHSLPKRKNALRRVNLTFRLVNPR